jgi:hypothetical protein
MRTDFRAALALLAVVAGCTLASRGRLDDLYGKPDPSRYDRAAAEALAPGASPASISSARAQWEKVAPVFETRCVVCHACWDAPCQLNLGSYEGVTRGANRESVYATRLTAAAPTRLFADALSTSQWRTRAFHTVLNERKASREADRDGSVMHRLLDLKRRQPVSTGVLPSDRYDFSLGRAQVCPTIEQMDELEKSMPELGMPYGLPALGDAEHATITEWITAGAPYAPPPPLDAPHLERIAKWEAFFNADSLKQQLASRYIYEHWYLAHLWFSDLPRGESFELVRSKTPPGRPIEVIATVRPFDDPGVERPYYRLRRVEESIVAKTHMPYALDDARLARMRELFLEPEYEVTSLPSYAAHVASNPFLAFRELPVRSRYRLMLEEAQFTIMGFIKGPVCRGQVALNVINDLFWVAFVDPEIERSELTAGELGRALEKIHLPAEDENQLPLLQWRKYAKSEDAYLKTKYEILNREFGRKRLPTLSILWDGDGKNRNAALTVLRHFDSATVVQGHVGEQPQTAWLVGYPLLERIHYLLVAGYDVYGNVGHQLTTRLYMDFLRMEGESNFLALLPLKDRDVVRDRWYRGVGDDVKQYLQGARTWFGAETGVSYRTGDTLTELYGMMGKQLAPVLDRRYELRTKGLPAATRAALARLDSLEGAATSHLPELTFLRVTGLAGGARDYTLVHNSAHTNISTLFQEAKNRVPAEDTTTLVEGFLGTYPNAFHQVEAAALPAYVDAIAGLRAEPDYASLMAKYGIRRTDPRFWAHSDALHAAYRRAAPVEAGLFDYNRYENR